MQLSLLEGTGFDSPLIGAFNSSSVGVDSSGISPSTVYCLMRYTLLHQVLTCDPAVGYCPTFFDSDCLRLVVSCVFSS